MWPDLRQLTPERVRRVRERNKRPVRLRLVPLQLEALAWLWSVALLGPRRCLPEWGHRRHGDEGATERRCLQSRVRRHTCCGDPRLPAVRVLARLGAVWSATGLQPRGRTWVRRGRCGLRDTDGLISCPQPGTDPSARLPGGHCGD